MNRRLSIDRVLSVGVEEEFLLCDVQSGWTVPAGAEVLRKVQGELGERAQSEFYATQIETNSRPHTSAGELRADLLSARRVVAGAAENAGCRLVASGTAVLTTTPLPLTEGLRYAEMARQCSDVVRNTSSESCGCHVHLGTLSRADALELSNHMRPWLPAIQSLAVNSPFAARSDGGRASWRFFEQRRWPTVGPAPLTDGWHYENTIGRLMDRRQILDRRMLYWYTRPSEHLPTLEVRIADVNADVDTTVLIATLLRGLGTTILARLRTGLSNPSRISQQRLLESHRSIACRGLAGWMVDPVLGQRVSAASQVRRLVEFSRPGLSAAGDIGMVERLLAKLGSSGTGADRQRADFGIRGSFLDVVGGLARRTVEG